MNLDSVIKIDGTVLTYLGNNRFIDFDGKPKKLFAIDTKKYGNCTLAKTLERKLNGKFYTRIRFLSN
jgi:hypothetical protein